jgi:hypothetical protein
MGRGGYGSELSMGKPLTQLIIYLYKWVDQMIQSMWDPHVDFTAIISNVGACTY